MDSVVSMVTDLFFGPKGVLDSIVPISMIMGFMDALGEISSIAGGIGQMFGGFTAITNITSQLNSYTSQATSMLSNPIQLAEKFITPEISQGLNAIRNPQALVENLLPKSVIDQMQQLQNVPGLGFVGNMGYGMRGTLKTLSEGVFTNLAASYTDQLGILSPNLNKSSNTIPAYDTQQAHSTSIDAASTNPNISTVQGIPIQAVPRSPIFSANSSGQSQQPANSPSSQTINLGAKTTSTSSYSTPKSSFVSTTTTTSTSRTTRSGGGSTTYHADGTVEVNP